MEVWSSVSLSPANPETCAVALKEWSVACRALEEGRQILLIRKGGLLDAEGIFQVEHPLFWLMPSKWHQDAGLLKPQHHDLLHTELPPPGKNIHLSSWASVEAVWSLDGEDPATEEKLGQLEHIWSSRYLDIRLGYQSGKPLQILALRVYNRSEQQVIPFDAEYFGCKSWVDLKESPALQPASPALPEAEFQTCLENARQILGQGAC